MLQLKNEIQFLIVALESLYETYLRFKKNLQSVPKHKMAGTNLIEILYRALNANTIS